MSVDHDTPATGVQPVDFRTPEIDQLFWSVSPIKRIFERDRGWYVGQAVQGERFCPETAANSAGARPIGVEPTVIDGDVIGEHFEQRVASKPRWRPKTADIVSLYQWAARV